MAAEALPALDAAPGDPGDDGTPAQCPPAVGEVVSFVGMELGRSTPRPAGALADCRYGIDQILQQLAVVPIGRRNPQGKGDAVGVHKDVALEARLAAIRWVRAGFLAPFLPACWRCP